MRFASALSFLFLAVSVVAVDIIQDDEPTAAPAAIEPDVTIRASFPSSNPFSHVVNGERNGMELVVENNSETNVTLISAGGAFLQPDSDTLIKNATALSYGVYLVSGAKMTLPYSFHSEFKKGDVRLRIWMDYLNNANAMVYRSIAYDSVVTVVEPELSLFDPKLLSTYLVVFAFLGGAGYYAYTLIFPAKKPKGKRTTVVNADISGPTGTVTATGVGGYQEEWIPEHHKRKVKGGAKGEALSSGDESGPEGRRRRGRSAKR